jgi:hypothetical protein
MPIVRNFGVLVLELVTGRKNKELVTGRKKKGL